MNPPWRRPGRSSSARTPQNARASVLAEWRGVDVTPLEKARAMPAMPLRAVMPQVLDRLGLERKRAEAEVVRVWNHLIDPDVTAHAQPTGVRNGTLFVSVDNNVWLHEILRYRRRDILTRLQSSFGKGMIAKISFRVSG